MTRNGKKNPFEVEMTAGETFADGPQLLMHPSLGEVRAEVTISFTCACGAIVAISHAEQQVQCRCGVIFALGWDVRLVVLRPVADTTMPPAKRAAAA